MPDQKENNLNYAELPSEHQALNAEILRLGRCMKNVRILRAMEPAKTLEGYSFSMEPYFPDAGEEGGVLLGIQKQGSRSKADSVSILVTEGNRVAVRKGGKWVVSENDAYTPDAASQLSRFLKKFADILERADPEDPDRIRLQTGKGIRRLADF